MVNWFFIEYFMVVLINRFYLCIYLCVCSVFMWVKLNDEFIIIFLCCLKINIKYFGYVRLKGIKFI